MTPEMKKQIWDESLGDLGYIAGATKYAEKANELVEQKDKALQRLSEDNRKAYDKLWNEKEDAIKEIERLKGLVEKAWWENIDPHAAKYRPVTTKETWQQFKTDNNL